MFSSVRLLSPVRLSVTPWTAAHQASLSFTIFQSLLKLMSTESVMPSNHLVPCHPLLLLPSIFPSIRVFSNELVLHIRWPKYWSLSISPSNENSGLISFRMDCLISLLSSVSQKYPDGCLDDHLGLHQHHSLFSTSACWSENGRLRAKPGGRACWSVPSLGGAPPLQMCPRGICVSRNQ